MTAGDAVRLVNTWPLAHAACARLRTARVIAMDIEGAPLGVCTSLLQLAVSPDEIYVFDVVALTTTTNNELFSSLRPILADPGIRKLCYDGRGDSAALWDVHGVRVEGLYDLQVVFTSLYQHAHDQYLKGLQHALKCANLPPHVCRAFAERKQRFKRRLAACSQSCCYEELLRRPLDPELLAYAAEDVAHLFHLYELWRPFVNERTVVAVSMERTSAQKERIMSRLDFSPLRVRRPRFWLHTCASV